MIIGDKGFAGCEFETFITGKPGGRTAAGVYSRAAVRLLALAAGIWRNWLIGAPTKRSLIAYYH